MTAKKTKEDVSAPCASPSLTQSRIGGLREAFESNAAYCRTRNAVTQVTVDDIALNRSVVTTIDHSFSQVVDDWPATNQKRSGRCWLFAGLNLFRAAAIGK